MACQDGDCELERPECVMEIAYTAIVWYMVNEERLRSIWSDGTWGEFVASEYRKELESRKP